MGSVVLPLGVCSGGVALSCVTHCYIGANLMILQLNHIALIVSLSLIDGFYIAFELSFYCSFLMALPAFLYHVWCFIVPALHTRERRIAARLAGAGNHALLRVGVKLGVFVAFYFTLCPFFYAK